MRDLLCQLEALTASRDRDQAAETVLSLARTMAGASLALLHKVTVTPRGYVLSPLAWAVEGHTSSANHDVTESESNMLAADPLIENCIASPDGSASEMDINEVRIAFSIGEPASPTAIFECRCIDTPDRETLAGLRHLLGIYSKHLTLLDYAELDTLTKLQNRKTFDENFDHFIEIADLARRLDGDERRNESQDKIRRPCWLAVVDIDRFKRINDNFGHLFGDEVLLRIAEVMKKSFRASDKLFRFGGEEFVVLLRHVSPENAYMVLDRFRKEVEVHEFPQVGQVTCSMGYVEIQSDLTPAEILGRADEALYYCKENGRNQIACYKALVDQGLLQGPATALSNAGLQADIDALFD